MRHIFLELNSALTLHDAVCKRKSEQARAKAIWRKQYEARGTGSSDDVFNVKSRS